MQAFLHASMQCIFVSSSDSPVHLHVSLYNHELHIAFRPMICHAPQRSVIVNGELTYVVHLHRQAVLDIDRESVIMQQCFLVVYRGRLKDQLRDHPMSDALIDRAHSSPASVSIRGLTTTAMASKTVAIIGGTGAQGVPIVECELMTII